MTRFIKPIKIIIYICFLWCPLIIRKNSDQSAKAPSKCQRGFSQDSNVGNAHVHESFGPNGVSAKPSGFSSSTSPFSPRRSNAGDFCHFGTNGFPSSPISPRRSNGRGGIFFSPFHNNNNNTNDSPNYSNKIQELVTKAEALNLRVNVPSKSAPASPRRSRAADRELQNILHHSSGNSRTLSPVRIMHSADPSPSNSPVTRNDNNTPPKSPKGISFPFLHDKRVSGETSAERPECINSHVNAHPLPLPPGATVTVTSQPVTLHHNTDVSSMKGQWQKGKLIGRGTFGSVYLATNRYVTISSNMSN